MTHYHAAVWIDHHEARIFDFNATDVATRCIRAEDPPRQLHHKAGVIGSGRTSEDEDFFEQVTAVISSAGVVLIAGPANAKVEFAKYLQSRAPSIFAKVSAVETVDHPTDREFLNYARQHFHADHQAPLRFRAANNG
ncbi:MAG: translational machinery protein [Rhodospirillales bacterium]|nr:translational machinery protein [Rhodospirillales bacterium]